MTDEELNHSSKVQDNEIKSEPNKEKTTSPQTTTSSVATTSSQEVKHSLPRVKVIQQGDQLTLKIDCNDQNKGAELLIKATGAEDLDFLQNILSQLANASARDGVIDENKLNSMLSTMKGLKPKNQSDAMLALQMAVVHDSAMSFACHLRAAETLPEVDSFGNVFNKLTRTYAAHLEVLQRGRSDNEQKGVVQYVSVNEGGQAIVGNVTQNASDNDNVKAGSTPAAITDAHAVPMPSIKQSEQPAKVPAKRRRRP